MTTTADPNTPGTDRPDLRASLKNSLHPVLHDLDVRIERLTVDGCHCNLVAEVALDAIMPTLDGSIPDRSTIAGLRASLAVVERQRDEAQDRLAEVEKVATLAERMADELEQAMSKERGIRAEVHRAYADRLRRIADPRPARVKTAPQPPTETPAAVETPDEYQPLSDIEATVAQAIRDANNRQWPHDWLIPAHWYAKAAIDSLREQGWHPASEHPSAPDVAEALGLGRLMAERDEARAEMQRVRRTYRVGPLRALIDEWVARASKEYGSAPAAQLWMAAVGELRGVLETPADTTVVEVGDAP